MVEPKCFKTCKDEPQELGHANGPFHTNDLSNMSRHKKAYCARHPKEGRCNAESITVANIYMRTVTNIARRNCQRMTCWKPEMHTTHKKHQNVGLFPSVNPKYNAMPSE